MNNTKLLESGPFIQTLPRIPPASWFLEIVDWLLLACVVIKCTSRCTSLSLHATAAYQFLTFQWKVETLWWCEKHGFDFELGSWAIMERFDSGSLYWDLLGSWACCAWILLHGIFKMSVPCWRKTKLLSVWVNIMLYTSCTHQWQFLVLPLPCCRESPWVSFKCSCQDWLRIWLPVLCLCWVLVYGGKTKYCVLPRFEHQNYFVSSLQYGKAASTFMITTTSNITSRRGYFCATTTYRLAHSISWYVQP